MVEGPYSPAAEIKKTTGKTSSKQHSWAERHPILARAAQALKHTPRSRQRHGFTARKQTLRDAYAPEHMRAGLPTEPKARASRLRQIRARAGT